MEKPSKSYVDWAKMNEDAFEDIVSLYKRIDSGKIDCRYDANPRNACLGNRLKSIQLGLSSSAKIQGI